MEDLRNSVLTNVHASRLKVYSDSSVDSKVFLSHVIHSETGMQFQRPLRLVGTDDGIKVHIRWKGLLSTEDKFEPIQQVYEDVSALLEKILQ